MKVESSVAMESLAKWSGKGLIQRRPGTTLYTSAFNPMLIVRRLRQPTVPLRHKIQDRVLNGSLQFIRKYLQDIGSSHKSFVTLPWIKLVILLL